MENLNLATLPKYLSNEAAAWELLERLRWPNGEVVCPHCGVIDAKHYFIAARSGERTTRTGTTTYRRLWKCRHCAKQFSVLVGTIFESSKVPVSKWLLAMWMFNAGKNGVSALELQRQLGIAYQTAWFMAHRLREAMTREPLSTLLTGTIVADETWVGGAPKNRHAHRRVGSKQGLTDKTPVVALVHKESGTVRTKVVANVNGENLRKVLTETCDPAKTDLHTDASNAYTKLGPEFASHGSVNHSIGEYVRDGISTNEAESFFSQFKRSLDGTHHNVSREHLHRYASEFEYRWNTRKMSDSERVQAMVDASVGKRLTYLPLTERD
ncbi:MAG: IS1595 family transposase [Acidimicrobiales bacterium]